MKFCYPQEMKELPPPEWILHELLQKNSTALMYGPSGLGKSFVALEMLFALATQNDGIFKPMREGRVLYISGEGTAGLGVRLLAWEGDRNTILPSDNPAFIGQALQLSDPKDRRHFITAVRKEFKERLPILIIFDTLARCAVGLDENSAKDMGLLVDGLEQIRTELGCSVLLVHHSTKASPKTERGSGAIFGAVDTVLSLQQDRRYLKLECVKQKNGEPAQTRRLLLKGHLDSCVLDASKVAEARSQQQKLLEVHTVAAATAVSMSKRTYMREAYPPPQWDWDGEAIVCAHTIIGTKMVVEQVSPTDEEFVVWRRAVRKFRQETKTDTAQVNPFAYTCEEAALLRSSGEDQDRMLEARRRVREGRIEGREAPYPACSDLDLAWWIWGVAEMGVPQVDVMRMFNITRRVVQRNVEAWRKYGLLPFEG